MIFLFNRTCTLCKVIQAGSGRSGISFLIPNTSLFWSSINWAHLALLHIRTGLTSKKGATGRLQVLESEAASRKEVHSPRSIAATQGGRREGAPQLDETSHRWIESHTSLAGGGESAWVSSQRGNLGQRTLSTTWEVCWSGYCYSKCGFRTSSIS